MQKVVIVGAGISGLALAYRLRQLLPTCQIQVLERQSRVGGSIGTEDHNGFRFEIGPNGFLDSKPTTLNLCRDLGLADRLLAASEEARRHRYLFLGGPLKALPAGLLGFLQTDLLSWRGKLGFLAERFRPRRRLRNDESIDAFVRRRVGIEAAEVFADALVTGIYAGDPKMLSVRSTFPRLPLYEHQHGSVLKGFAAAGRQRRLEAQAHGEPAPMPGQMWSFREGLCVLVDTLAQQLGDSVQRGVSLRRLERSQNGENRWSIRGDGDDTWHADAVVLTCPAYEQANLLAGLDPMLTEQIAAIPYNRVAVVALGFRRDDVPGSLDGFGFIAPQRLRRDLIGVQWCSSIFPDRAPPGCVLLRAMCGGWHRPEIVGWDDDRLLRALLAELRLAQGIQALPLFHRIVRWDRAIPQYLLGHQHRVAAIEQLTTRHPGLFLGGNAYHGVAMNDCTEQAEVLAKRIQRFLG